MIDLNTLKSNLAAGMREVDAETAKDLVALTERLQSELTAAHEQLGYTAKPNDSQDWSKISGAVAHQLIERHADDWREAGDMMEAFAASRAAARPAVDDTCHHDELVRLGAIWTKCEQCGKKWADDEGGVPQRAILAAQQVSADDGPDFTVEDPDLDALLNAAADWGRGAPQNMDTGLHLHSLIERVSERLKAPADAGQAQALADAELPPLPQHCCESRRDGELLCKYYSEDQMQDYARACMALRQPAADANGLPPLPEHDFYSGDQTSGESGHSDQQMRDYGAVCHALGRGAAVREYIANGSFSAQCAAPDERAAFEAWAKRVGYDVSSFKAEGDTTYSTTFANVAFEGFQAGRASLAPPAPAAHPEAKAAPVDALPEPAATFGVQKAGWGAEWDKETFTMLHEHRPKSGEKVKLYTDAQVCALLAAAGNSQGQAAQPEHGIYWQGEQITTTARLIEIVKEWAAKAWDDGHKAAQPEQQPVVDDLAALVRQLVHSLAKAKPDSPLVERALDYLRRKGLQGSPLRADAAPVPAAAPGPLGGWQPIETAPLEGLIDILMPDGKRWCGVYYDRICDEWRNITPHGKIISVKRNYPTHWMPLPAAPAPKGEQHG